MYFGTRKRPGDRKRGKAAFDSEGVLAVIQGGDQSPVNQQGWYIYIKLNHSILRRRHVNILYFEPVSESVLPEGEQTGIRSGIRLDTVT